LHRLAENLDRRLARLAPGRQISQQTMLLAAMELAHDLEEAHRARRRLEDRHRTALKAVLGRIDSVLGETAPEGVQSAADPDLDFDADPVVDIDFGDESDPPTTV
jgi:cell division protein ZapA